MIISGPGGRPQESLPLVIYSFFTGDFAISAPVPLRFQAESTEQAEALKHLARVLPPDAVQLDDDGLVIFIQYPLQRFS